MSQLVLNQREAAKASENMALGWDEAAPSRRREMKGRALPSTTPYLVPGALHRRAGFLLCL